MAEDLLTRSKRYLTKQELVQSSTFYDVESVWSRLFEVVAAESTAADPLNQFEWLNPLDEKVHRALDKTKSIGPHNYLGEPITTVAHQYYTNTSAWWLIVAFNGYLHPDEIPTGQDIEIPDLEGFLEYYRAQTRQAKRTIVF